MREILSVHKIGYRLLGMIHGVDSTIMPLHLLEVCLSAVQVYAGLYLTAACGSVWAGGRVGVVSSSGQSASGDGNRAA